MSLEDDMENVEVSDVHYNICCNFFVIFELNLIKYLRFFTYLDYV